MLLKYMPDAQILFTGESRQAVLDHCHLSLQAYLRGQAEGGKAFGLVCGTISGPVLRVANCFPLQKNVRDRSPYKEHMDRMMVRHAVHSQTPLDKRGWVADPAELFARIKECRGKQQILLGTYHMHRVGWEHDRVRDTPTSLDTVLAKESGLLMFIISMVEPARPIIRAFYEGMEEKEIPIVRLSG